MSYSFNEGLVDMQLLYLGSIPALNPASYSLGPVPAPILKLI